MRLIVIKQGVHMGFLLLVKKYRHSKSTAESDLSSLIPFYVVFHEFIGWKQIVEILWFFI